MAAHGHFHWNELMTRDVEAAKAFYTRTVGWSFDGMPMPEGTYWVAMMDGAPVAGIFTMTDTMFAGMAECWFPYLAVDDIDVRVAAAKAAGATVTREPWHVEGVGRIAILKQPDGATVGWMTPSS